MKTQITDTILLRTLTKKSLLPFGKYSNNTIEKLMEIKPQYLMWIYYNIENITFIEEILIWLHIDKCGYINKPGKDTDKWDEIIIATETKYTSKNGYQFLKSQRKIKKDHIKIQNSSNQNLAKLAWYNQGHR